MNYLSNGYFEIDDVVVNVLESEFHAASSPVRAPNFSTVTERNNLPHHNLTLIATSVKGSTGAWHGHSRDVPRQHRMDPTTGSAP